MKQNPGGCSVVLKVQFEGFSNPLNLQSLKESHCHQVTGSLETTEGRVPPSVIIMKHSDETSNGMTRPLTHERHFI